MTDQVDQFQIRPYAERLKESAVSLWLKSMITAFELVESRSPDAREAAVNNLHEAQMLVHVAEEKVIAAVGINPDLIAASREAELVKALRFTLDWIGDYVPGEPDELAKARVVLENATKARQEAGLR